MKFLSSKDMEGIPRPTNSFDALVLVAQRALELHNQPLEHPHSQNSTNNINIPNKRLKQELNPAPSCPPQPPAVLPKAFKDAICKIGRGRDISEETLVIQKGLFATDLNKNHNRLSIPIKKVVHEFLTGEEKNFLDRKDDNNRNNHKEVHILEPSLKHTTAKLSKWDLAKGNGKSSSCYVINGSWRHIVERNALEAGMVVQLWAFKIEEELWFALVRI